MLDKLRQSDFEALLSDRFKINLNNNQTVEAELIEVNSIGSVKRFRGETKRMPFALVFKETEGPRLEQGMYPITHPVLENIEIFLVPVGSSEEGMLYEAVFN